MIRNRYALLAFRIIVGGLFLYAAVLKIRDPLEFAQDVRDFRLVGQNLSFLTAVILPWVELLAGVFLIAGLWRKGSALLVSLMLGFFIVLILATIARGLDVDCGCFGHLSRKADFRLLVEDGLMLYMSLCLYLKA